MRLTYGALMQAILSRKSVRRYRSEAIDTSSRQALLEVDGLRRLNIAPCRAEYIESPESLDHVFTGIIGSYGKIRGARAALCLITPSHEKNLGQMEAGYLGEQYVLRAAALGLGTCWVGGTFDYKKLMGHCSIGPEEKVIAIIALGWPAEDKDNLRHMLHSMVRHKEMPAIASKNLLWGPPWLTTAIHAAGRAPSAINLQPWFFSGTPERVELKASRNGAFTSIDLGIAMLHFEAVILAYGHSGKWEFDKGIPNISVQPTEVPQEQRTNFVDM
ncbi:MAG: hypothetical protein DDT35_01312 [Firmicutes bacterium]|nr:hypothetical protein [Bacillota bacterium]